MLANPFDPNPNPCYLHVIYIENLKTLTLGRNGAITHVIYMLSTPIQPWCEARSGFFCCYDDDGPVARRDRLPLLLVRSFPAIRY